MKSALRKEIKSRITSLADKEKKSEIISDKIFDLIIENGYEKVALFISTPYEPDTKKLIARLFANGKKVYAPKTDNGEMDFYKLDKNTIFTKNKFGLTEPTNGEICNEFDIVLVPLVAFDKNKNRLGHGGGYYDKFLSKFSLSAPKIGMAFGCQEAENVFPEPHDIRLDDIITE